MIFNIEKYLNIVDIINMIKEKEKI